MNIFEKLISWIGLMFMFIGIGYIISIVLKIINNLSIIR